VLLDSARLAEAAARAGLAGAALVVWALDPPAAPIGVEAGRSLYPASMIKVPLAAAVLAEVARGRLGPLEARVAVDQANMTANDAQSPLVPGYAATLRELIHLAIARSDNVATNLLFDAIGRERATAVVRDELGLKDTAFHRKLSGSDPLIHDPGWDGIHRNAHPASDAATLFQKIANGTVPLSGVLRAALEEQVWNGKLSAGLAPGDRFAHKTGDTSEVTHDGGILTTAQGRRYAIVAYTAMASTDEHNARFGPFMASLRNGL